MRCKLAPQVGLEQQPYTTRRCAWNDARGGKTLPQAMVSGGRSDMRLAMDASGELYILSKSDGMIRAVVSVVER